MHKKIQQLLVLIIINSSTILHSQIVYQDISNKPIYELLDELANERVISVNSAVKPYSRYFIANKLTEAQQHNSLLNERQKKEIDFYLRDYNKELLIGKYKNKRFDLFYYSDSLFTFSLNGIFGGQGWSNENGTNYHRWYGAEAFSYAGKHLGIYASLRDNQEKDFLSDTNVLTKRKGAMHKTIKPFDYSEMRGGVTVSWKWGTIGIVKDHLEWGTNYNYPNIISSKAPSFAHLKLHLYPSKWFEFNYIHGWLVSEVIDSTKSYSYNGVRRDVFHSKYIASNIFTFKPWSKLNLSFGNSIVYSDVGIHPAYLIPVFFYKSVDHTYNSTSDYSGQNSQLFFDISARLIKKTHFYYAMFLDDLSFTRMFDPDQQSNHWSMKWGVRISNLLPNIFVTAEYTRSNPLAYQNDLLSTLYNSNFYWMGHYLKDNADELYLALDIRPISRLTCRAWYSICRKGPEYPYIRERKYIWGKKFMESVEWKQQIAGLKIEYQVLNDFFMFSELEKQTVDGNFENYNAPFYWGNTLTFSFGLNVGFY